MNYEVECREISPALAAKAKVLDIPADIAAGLAVNDTLEMRQGRDHRSLTVIGRHWYIEEAPKRPRTRTKPLAAPRLSITVTDKPGAFR